MMTTFRSITIIFSFLILSSLPLSAGEPDAKTIMDLANSRFRGNYRTASITMTLIDKFGTEKTYTTRNFQNNTKETLFSFMVFTMPMNVRGTAFLMHDYNVSKKNIQWLYLPALKNTAQIEASARNTSFMGSDFSFNDLNRKSIEDYDFQLIDESKVDGKDVWRIKSTPVSEEVLSRDGYEKSVRYIRKDNYVIVRAVHWVKGSEALKYYSVNRLEKIDDIWVPMEFQMTLKQDGKIQHQTVFKLDDVKFNQTFDSDIFTKDQMEKKSALVCDELKK